jgi:hypothetical protein
MGSAMVKKLLGQPASVVIAGAQKQHSLRHMQFCFQGRNFGCIQ